MTRDEVTLLSEDGTPVGAAPRATVHTADTPLHLAFSCYVFRADGSLLLTRRALDKRTWPGVWTNSFCGHPRPEESLTEAIGRHAGHELGLELDAVRCVLPDFRYRAVDASGVVENEICPVHVATTTQEPLPNPHEVVEYRWVEPRQAVTVTREVPWAVSPWMVSQVGQLVSAGLLGEGAPS